MSHDLLAQVPNSSRLKQRSYYLSITAFAHIIERHYYRIERHPGTGKFSVPIPDIIQHIKEAKEEPPLPVHGTSNLYRTKNTGTIIGHERNGTPTTLITAFPRLTLIPALLSDSRLPTHDFPLTTLSPSSRLTGILSELSAGSPIDKAWIKRR